MNTHRTTTMHSAFLEAILRPTGVVAGDQFQKILRSLRKRRDRSNELLEPILKRTSELKGEIAIHENISTNMQKSIAARKFSEGVLLKLRTELNGELGLKLDRLSKCLLTASTEIKNLETYYANEVKVANSETKRKNLENLKRKAEQQQEMGRASARGRIQIIDNIEKMSKMEDEFDTSRRMSVAARTKELKEENDELRPVLDRHTKRTEDEERYNSIYQNPGWVRDHIGFMRLLKEYTDEGGFWKNVHLWPYEEIRMRYIPTFQPEFIEEMNTIIHNAAATDADYQEDELQ